MGRVKKIRHPFFREKDNGNGNGKRKRDNGKNPSSSHKVLFEAIEPRILLSTDLSYAGAAAFDLTIRLDNDTQTLQLIDNNTTTAVAEQALSDTNAVVITGSAGADNLTIDFSSLFTLPGGISFTDDTTGDNDTLEITGRPDNWNISGNDAGNAEGGGGIDFAGLENLAGGADADIFTLVSGGSISGLIDGGAGSDTLVGADTINIWDLTGSDAGSLNDQDFTGIENLEGGGDRDDFVLRDGAGVTGTIEGRGGSNALDYSSYTSGVTVNLGDGTATGAGGISNIQNATGGTGNDTLIGPDADTTWDIEGTDTGDVAGVHFAGIENLTGGTGADTFVFADGSGVSGVIDGGGGINTLDYSAYTTDVTVDLEAGAATSTGGVANIQNVTGGSGNDTLTGDAKSNILTGGAGDDVLTGGLGVDPLHGGAGIDTLVEQRDADFTLTDNALTIGAEGSDSLSGLEKAVLTGGTSSNTMNASSFTGSVVLVGEEEDDIFIIDLGAYAVDGGAGKDTLVAGDKENTWEIMGEDSGMLNGRTFKSIENLIGGVVADSFILAAGAMITGLVDGRQGEDRLTGSNTPNIWKITGPDSGKLNEKPFIDIENLKGGADKDVFLFSGGSADSVDGGGGMDTLCGPVSDSRWTIAGQDAGEVEGIPFTSIENLAGAADNEDTFVFEASGGISGLVDGGPGGFDSIILAGGTFDTVSYVATGPDSGTITRDANAITYSGLEPVQDTSVAGTLQLSVMDPGPHTITLSDDSAPNDAGESRFTSLSSETIDFTNPATALVINGSSGVDTITINALDAAFIASLTVNVGDSADVVTVNAVTGGSAYAVNGDAGADQIHVGAIGVAKAITATGGTGSDTYFFGDGWGQVTVVEAADLGSVDVLNFSTFNGTITIDVTGGGAVDIIGSDGSKVILSPTSAANIEEIVGANINLTGLAGSVKGELVGGLEKLVTFGRNAAQVGGLATSLPLIGGNASVAVSKALDFAEALDELRLEVEEFFANNPTVTTNDLVDYINSIFSSATRTLQHLGAAIFSPNAIVDGDILAADVYEFQLTLDGATTVHLVVDVNAADPTPTLSGGGSTVTVGIAPAGPYTVAQLRNAINAGLSTLNATSGAVLAAERGGRIAFEVVSTEMKQFSVEGLQAAITKLGFKSLSPVLLDNIQDILRNLGDLNVHLGSAMTLATTFDSGTPKLRFAVDYRPTRTSDFFYDLGAQAQSLGLAFDLDAKIEGAAALVFDFDLGLSLTSADSDFFLDVSELRAGISTTLSAETVTDVGLKVGFLGATVNGTLSLDAGVTVPTTGLTNISDPSTISITPGDLTLTGSDGTGSPAFDLNLTIDVAAGSSLGGFSASATLTASGDPFDGSDITLNADTDFTTKFVDFNNMNAAGVVSLIGKVSDWLDSLRGSDLITSLNIPFVQGALDKILDLKEVLSDALLFDEGPDNVKDGADKLVTDLNTALANANLDSLIRAQGDGSKITLVTIDPKVTSFSIAKKLGNDPRDGLPFDGGGFADLGFINESSSGTPQAISENAAVLLGKLSGRAGFTVTVNRTGLAPYIRDVSLETSATTDNKGIGDDVPKLLDANNAPTFSTAQEFSDRLSQIVTKGLVHYDVSTKILTLPVSFTDVPLFSVELPTDFTLDLSPIGNVQSGTRLIIDAKGGIQFTLGFDLNETPAGSSVLTTGTTLSDLGVVVKQEEAASADSVPRTIVGQLSGDANFTITYNPTVDVTVPKLIGQPGTDVNVTQRGGDQSETAIAVNPVKPDNIIIGANDLNSTDGLNATPANDYVWVTHNGGANWTRVLIPIPAGGNGNSAGDPAIVFSRDGKLVIYTHMIEKDANHNAIATALSTDGGDTWLQADTRVIGSLALDEDGDGVNDSSDKNYIAVGPRDASHLNEDRFIVTWQRHNVIYSSTSLDGLIWTAPVVVGGLLAGKGSPVAEPSGSSIDAIPSFGPNGEIYVVWEDFGNSNDGASRIKFDSSLDGGVRWGGGHDAKVFFATAESALTPDDEAILDTFANVLNANPLLIATIAGYTDTVGTPGGNQTLSDSRAASVFNYLTVTKGIAAARLTQLGFGETHLAVSTGQEVDNAQNRRVELSLDEVIYSGYVNVFRDPFNGGTGLDGVDETTSPAGLGEYEIPGQDTRGIWMGLSMDVDLSGSAYDGRIYLAFTDQGDLDGNADAANATDHHNTDIFVIASDDKGATWTALAASPDAVGADQVRVNDDLGTASQWFSWLDVDQSTGTVAISWYDTRNDTGATSGADTDVLTNTGVQYFAAVSRDFGLTWDTNLQVSDGTSNVSAAVAGAGTAANQFGDYSGLDFAFANSTIYMAWADNSNSTGDHVPAWPASLSTEVYYDTIPLINNTIDDLLADINAIIADRPLLTGKFEAQADGSVVKIVAVDAGVTSFTVTTTKTDPAFRDLGFQETADAVNQNGSLVVKAAKDAPTLVGQLTADASFSIDLDGAGSGLPVTVTVPRADTVSAFAPNRNILDLVNDVQKAVKTALGTDKITVSSEGGRLLFTRVGAPVSGTADAFTIAPISNANELGITATKTSDEADLIITVDDGTKYRIVLDGLTSIGDLIGTTGAIYTQTSGAVTASLTVDDPKGQPTPVNEANTGLTLVDNTAGGTPSGNFMVAKANGSLAGIKLGIIGTDKNPSDNTDVADGKIIGATIAGATLLDRFFIQGNPNLSDVIDASVDVSAGLVVKDLSVVAANTINSSSFKFKTAQVNKQIQIKDVSGFTSGTFTINAVNETTNQATLSGSPGDVGLVGGVGLLKTGVQAAANFGFVGIGLSGTASLGADLTLGFNPTAPELSDNKLTLQELVNSIKQGHVLDLLAPPNIQPISPATDFGKVDLTVSLSAGSADFSGLAATLLGGSPSVSIQVVTLGDPFIGTRFVQAGYAKVNDTEFTVNGDFTSKLPSGVVLRFDGTNDVNVTAASYDSGTSKTTVTVAPAEANPSFGLPATLTGVDVTLQPKVNITTTDLGGLPDFSNLSFDDIIKVLQSLAAFLGQFESFGFLNTDLPVINKSINDLLAFADDFAKAVEEAQANPAGSLQVLENKINEAIGISSSKLTEIFNTVGKTLDPSLTDDAFDLSFDKTTGLMTLDFSLGAGFSRGLDMSIPGIDFGSALASLGLGNILDLSGSAGIKAEGAVLLRLSFGVDVANFDINDPGAHLFILDTTGLDAKATVGGEDIAFRVGVGPFALSIASTDTEKSKIEIAGTASAGLKSSVFTDGRVSFSTIFGNLSTSNFDASLTGTITGTLPVFFPNDSTKLGTILIGGSNNDPTPAFTPTGDLTKLLTNPLPVIKTSASQVLAPDSLVIDVHDIVDGISNFNFASFSLFNNIFLAVDGLDLALGFIQDTVGGKIGGFTFPLIGDKLAGAAHFIADLREDFIAPLRSEIEKAKNAAQDFADPDKNIISKLIFDLLGPNGSLQLLKQTSGNGDSPGDFITLNTNLADFLFNPNTTLQLSDTFIEWDLDLGQVLANESSDIGFDLGIPGLNLKTEGDITLDVEWQMDLGFGLSFKDGFYLKVDNPHELLFDVGVTLPAAISGTLGFLGLRAEDKTININGVDYNTGLGATFEVNIFEDDGTGAAVTGDDGKRLGFTEFGSIGLDAGIAAEAAATLGAELGLSPDLFSQIFGPGAANVISGFPKITSDFVFLWELGTRDTIGATLADRADNSTFIGFDSGFGNAIEEGLKLVEFKNVALDLGSFLSQVLGPIVKEVGKYTEPIQPLIDFITSPIPIIGQLGLNVTWLDLAQTLAGDNFDVGLIQSVAEIITLINKIADLSDAGPVKLPIGDMVIYNSTGVGTGFTPALWDGGLDLGGTFNQINNPASGLLTSLVDNAGGIGNALSELASGGLGGKEQDTANALADVVSGTSAGGFHFPFLENPSSIFGLLMGKPVDLVTYDLAPLEFAFDFSVFFSIFGPLGVSINLDVKFTADTAFGYDTLGIQEFVETGFRNPGLLFDGFFISDSPKLNGVDDPELTFLTQLSAAAELNLGIARAGVAAALGFEILFDLFDPNHDMKIRFSELAGNIENQLRAPSDADKLLAPLAIFDVSGEIFAKLFAFLKIDLGFFSFSKDFPIYGPVTLASFDIDFFRPPILASEQDNGDLIVNTGKFAKERELGNATDVAEYLVIQSAGTDGDFVNVKVKAGDGALGEDSQEFLSYRVKKGGKIIIDGGQGDDKFDLTAFTEGNVLFDIDLGVGNDKLIWPSSTAGGVAGEFSTITGGSGDDEIDGSGGRDLIYGSAGNDTITANGGGDLIFGDEGEIGTDSARGLVKPTDGGDTINAGGGKDIVFGSGGKDDIKGGDLDDLLLGGGGLVLFTDSTVQKIFDNAKALTQDGVTEVENLLLDPTAGDKVSGEGGNDIIFGTAGPDDLTGGNDNDIIFGLSGFDKIDGGSGDDTIFGDTGKLMLDGSDVKPVPFAGGDADNIQGGAGLDKIYGGGGGDFIQGGDDADEIYGGSGPDLIFGDNGHLVGGVPTLDAGSDGGDNIFGEGEPDKIYGGGGIDQIDGGAGNDFIKGGVDSDLIITNKSSDFLDGEGGSDTYLISFQGGNAVALTTVLDTGASTDVDIFVATGTVFDDNILLRANTDGSIAFVAMINSEFAVERINYSFVERIVVNGSFGDDYFASDDTASEVTLNGEFGNDTFQIGQMFKSERTTVAANVSVDDVFATIETTRGFLSNGISAPMTINGGIGDDLFVVFHNKAVLQLNGEEGDDVFEIRAFALAGSQEPQRERTDISGGAGADLIQYAVNAPVNIDGGDGFDTVVIIGTEFGDDFVITEDGVFGAGLNVNFVNIESLRVDGAEGNDRFFVKSTSEKFITEIFGGLGSDTFNMSGDTPPIVSDDLKGHSGLIVQDVESVDPRLDEQKIFGISANVADNDEPFAVIRPTGGSTIITEGSILFDSYEIVLTRKPDKDVLIQALAPIPTPDSRERRSLAFRLNSLTKDSLTLDGTGLTLRFTASNWYIPQTVQIFADATALTDIAGLFTRPELGDGGGVLPVSFDMDDDAYEGVRFGVVNHLIKTESTSLSGLLLAVNNATPTVDMTDPGGILTKDLLGRKVFITSGPGAGQVRFIIGVVDNGATFTLTVDRPYLATGIPDLTSGYFISIDDAIVGKMTGFNETPSGLPPITDPNDHRSTFTDTAATFPTVGEGLTGRILEIIGGPGAGQQRLILGNLASDPTHTLILNGPWRTDPVAGQSIYRIERYEGLSIPSMSVQINDNDRAGLIVDETKGFKDNGDNVPNAPDIMADFDTITAVIEGGNGDWLGEKDIIQVQLSHDPGGTVNIGLIYDHAQLLLTNLSGTTIDNSASPLVFNSGNWNTPQAVLVSALADGVREGFHSSLIQFNIISGSADGTAPKIDTFETIPDDKPVLFVGLSFTPVAGSVTVTLNGSPLVEADSNGHNGNYRILSNKIVFVDNTGDVQAVSGDIVVTYNYTVPGFLTAFTTPVLARINDVDAPTVLVRETGGSTDVIEVKKGGSDPASIPLVQDTNQSPWIDTYELVLTGQPTGNVVVTVTPEITKTTRTGGIRHDAIQVEISSADSRVTPSGANLIVTFNAANWDDPVVIKVKAKDDAVVDGSDTQVFAPGPNTVSGILGPVVLEGAGGRGSLAINAPLMLPGETNRRTSDGNVVEFTANPSGVPGALEAMKVETADLQTKLLALGFVSTAYDELIGLTVEMSKGQGVDVVLDPTRPKEKFDRFWLITAIDPVVGDPDHMALTLQNPSQLNVSALAPSAVPNSNSEYAITSLSVNFFVDEKTQVDYMFVHDEDSPADSTGVLTSTRLSGLNMGPDLVIGGQLRSGGITYGDLEVEEINLGKGNNNFTVLGTHTREDGYQTWTFLNMGDEPVPFNGVQGDTVTVKLNAVDAMTATGTTSAAVNPSVSNGLKTTVTIAQSFADNALAGQLMSIVVDGSGQADGQVRRILGNTGNVLTVDRPWEFLPSSEAYQIINEADGAFAVDLQGGNDTLDASASSLGIVAFGGLGSDSMTSGSGDDIIFGDRGRVDYFNEIGAIVTRLGDAPKPITGFVTEQVTPSTLSTITDTGPKKSGGVSIGTSFPVPDDIADGGGTDDIGLRGLYVDINNGHGFLQTIRLITNNTATTLSLVEPFDTDPAIGLPGPVVGDLSEYRISTYPEDQTDGVVRAPSLLLSVDNDLVDGALGANDTINGGGGKDQVFGGAGKDTISAGAGDDVVLGDAGRIDRSRDPGAPTAPKFGEVVGSFLSLVRTIDFAQGDDDIIKGDENNDILIGGTEDDTIDGGGQTDIVLGDQGVITLNPLNGKITLVQDPGPAGDDILSGGADSDLIIGGLGNDTISGNGSSDILIGDEADVSYASDGVTIVQINTIDRTNGGIDTIYGGTEDDVLIGGANDDNLDGGLNQDIIFGDNVLLVRNAGSGDAIDPRFRALTGTIIYDSTGLDKVGGEFGAAVQPVPDGRPAWADWHITLDQTLTAADFGNDYIAGGGGNDEIFGQLGNDTIQGDGSIDTSLTGGQQVGASRDANNALVLHPSFEAATDGDDYIEGNGGNDVIFGNLGQDDIIGGSSSLFSLTTPSLRPDGSDLILGGAGTEITRNDLGNTAASGHARDADMILGDNGNIYRLVGINGTNGGAYLTFNYDNYNTLKIIPRAAQLLDYTPGGPDYSLAALNDIGAADEIHGESGDDFIYGMKGSDVLYGEGQDDDLIGGYGNDWISGGTGDDGVLGDDGRIFTTRNSSTIGEPLYGITALLATDPDTRFSNGNVLNEFIYTPGKIQQSTINVVNQLKKTFNIEPFSVDPNWNAMADEFGDIAGKPRNSDDIIYGGLGNDFLHGGAGDDAISGAEALLSRKPTDPVGPYTVYDYPSYDKPYVLSNVLGYDATKTIFAKYDEYNPLARIPDFLLNFNENEGVLQTGTGTVGSQTGVAVYSDGNDEIFGDLGNDWLVGGTGKDHLYGGWGNDLLNADDNLSTNNGANDAPDTHASYEDIAYGGAGRDVLIGNTGGDRLIDWVGEYNSYLVPFAPFGMATVSRTIQPQLPEYLYALSASGGADPTRATDTGAEAIRNGEPWGELGVIIQKDFAWQDQTGAPRDVQAGNIPGGKRDVLRAATFNSINAANPLDGFAVDSGSFTVANGALQVAAQSLGKDAAAVFYVDQALPSYYEVLASLSVQKPNGGWKANAYIIFDYYSPTDFKFAGIDVSLNRFVMGHRNTQGWILDAFTPTQVKPDIYYNLLLAVNGTTATLSLDNARLFSYTYGPRMVDGYACNLNTGMVGVGSDNSRGVFDNITVQRLAPQVTFQDTEDFLTTMGLFTPTSGSWQLSSGRYAAAPVEADRAVSLVDLQRLGASSSLDFEVTLNTKVMGGFIYDYYTPQDFKYVAINAATNQVVFGHHTAKGWFTDAVTARTIGSGVDHKLTVSLRGTIVNATLDGQAVNGYVYNAITIDGKFGLFSANGSSSFDNVTFKTDDPAFRTLLASAQPDASVAGGGSNLTAENLDAIVDAAIIRLGNAYGLDAGQLALLDGVNLQIADLGGLILGETIGTTVFIDTDAAGYGWFIDTTPNDDREFSWKSGDGELMATSSSEAYRDMDLLTVVMHELGHVLGYEHMDGNGLMDATLDAGERIVPADVSALAKKGKNNGNGNGAKETLTLVFDESSGKFVDTRNHRHARIDDHALKFDPSEWEHVGVGASDDDSDWIIEV